MGLISWLWIDRLSKRQKEQEEKMDKLIDQKVEAKLKEMQAKQNLPVDKDTDSTLS